MSSAESFGLLVTYSLVAVVFFLAFMAATRRSNTHSELVPGDVGRDLHAIVASIDGIPKLHVARVDTFGSPVIRARRNLSNITIRVELRQEEPILMRVTVTVRGTNRNIHPTLHRQVMQAVYSAQDRHMGGPSPFGPTAPT
jgi:hypothetical protein